MGVLSASGRATHMGREHRLKAVKEAAGRRKASADCFLMQRHLAAGGKDMPKQVRRDLVQAGV
eukprot:8676785-Lingulodinium_polyedra.AAC.1